MALNRETNFGFGLTIAAIVRRLAECEFRPAATRQSCRTGPDIPRSSPERELLSCLALDRRRLTRRHRALDPKREALIQETIKVFYLKPTRPSVARLVHEIRTRCLALRLAATELAHRQSAHRRS